MAAARHRLDLPGSSAYRSPVAIRIDVDDRTLSWHEFGKLLTSFAGWGMRLIVVPDDELHKTPRIEVREPPLRHSAGGEPGRG